MKWYSVADNSGKALKVWIRTWDNSARLYAENEIERDDMLRNSLFFVVVI